MPEVRDINGRIIQVTTRKYVDDKVTAAIAALSIPDYLHQSLNLRAYSAKQGTWSFLHRGTDTSFIGASTAAATADDGDYLEYKIWLPAGNYYLWFAVYKASDAGILKTYQGTNLIDTEDCYTAVAGASTMEISFAIVSTGQTTIKFLVDGKNGASTDYAMILLAPILIGRY